MPARHITIPPYHHPDAEQFRPQRNPTKWSGEMERMVFSYETRKTIVKLLLEVPKFFLADSETSVGRMADNETSVGSMVHCAGDDRCPPRLRNSRWQKQQHPLRNLFVGDFVERVQFRALEDVGDPVERRAPRSRSWIFTWCNVKTATSPFIYKGSAIFLPEKLGNLQAPRKTCKGGGGEFCQTSEKYPIDGGEKKNGTIPATSDVGVCLFRSSGGASKK